MNYIDLFLYFYEVILTAATNYDTISSSVDYSFDESVCRLVNKMTDYSEKHSVIQFTKI